MKNHIRKGIVAAAAVVALGAAPAPAYATVEADHCLHPPYTETAPYCACVLVGTVSNMVFPDAWACLKP